MQTDYWIYKYILWRVLEGKNARVLVGRTTGLCVVDRLSWKGILWKGSVQSRKYLSKLCIRVLCKHAQICGVGPTSSHVLRDLIPLSIFFCRCFCVFFLHWLLPSTIIKSLLFWIRNITLEFFSPALLIFTTSLPETSLCPLLCWFWFHWGAFKWVSETWVYQRDW